VWGELGGGSGRGAAVWDRVGEGLARLM
jgi:hypothetical protein